MAFWETFFVIFGSVIAGLILSLAIIYIITRIQKKPMFTPQKVKPVSAKKTEPEPIAILTATRNKSNGQEKDSLEELLKNHKKPESIQVKAEVVKAQSPSPKPGDFTKSEFKPPMVIASVAPAEKKRTESSRKQKGTETVRGKIPSPKPAVSKKVESEPAMVNVPADNLREELLMNLKKAEPVTERSPSPKSDIYKELESNLAIATAPWAGKLTPFPTTFWDSDHIRVEPLLARHQEEITQVYIDIRLANSIVWLSNEVGHRSKDLDESYKQLCIKIAERLKEVITR
jgi:hypothetical protein